MLIFLVEIKILIKLFSCFFIFFLSFQFTKEAYALETQPSILVVNPVRISSYNKDPGASISSQYRIIKEFDFSSTWLLTPDSMNVEAVTQAVSKFNEKQELGIFFEINEETAKGALVPYIKPDHWHFARSLFLVGYETQDRIKLIDYSFENFKSKFGFYPKSVGGWWIDSYSLNYMKEKYGIVAYLNCNDQWGTDTYTLWGQPWGVPYYPSRLHSGIPGDGDGKIDVVAVSWAAREPERGYSSSLYSTQDYFTLPEKLETKYFEELLRLYLFGQNAPGSIVVGLESDFTPETYKGEFLSQMNVVKKLLNESVSTQTMSSFSDMYRQNYKEMKSSTVSSKVTDKKYSWFQSNKYRVGFFEETNSLSIFDLRNYSDQITEPYLNTPLRENELVINVPASLDSRLDAEDVWKVDGENAKIKTFDDYFEVAGVVTDTIPRVLHESPYFTLVPIENGVRVIPHTNVGNIEGGVTLLAIRPEVLSVIQSKKFFLGFILLVIAVAIIARKSGHPRIVIVLFSFLSIIFLVSSLGKYFVTNGELAALEFLKSQPEGMVLVPDRTCLQCEYHMKYPYAATINSRSYINVFSKKSLVYDNKPFNATHQSESKEHFDKTEATYVYLTKVEGYQEKIPFSPGDWGVTLIFKNANSEIWKVEKNQIPENTP